MLNLEELPPTTGITQEKWDTLGTLAASFDKFSLWYTEHQALYDVTLPFPENKITAVIGPSGCGKSTLLRSINRMNDLIPGVRCEGGIDVFGQSCSNDDQSLLRLRSMVGMVFQRPTPFPRSIYENIAYGLRIHGMKDRKDLDKAVNESLVAAGLWEEVENDLKKPAVSLSGGQQQRLCIARVLALKPKIILLDEPCSSLDPISTAVIEDLMRTLSKDYSLMIVTHNMQQAARVSDYAAFMLTGRLIEFEETRRLFEHPNCTLTEQYITGRFG